MPQLPLSNPWDIALRLVHVTDGSNPLQVPAPLTLGPQQAVERLEALWCKHDNDSHSYHFPVGSQGSLASVTHGEVVVWWLSLGSGAGVESQTLYLSTVGP